MPLIRSAIKQMRQNRTRRQRNLITKRQYKSLMKQYETLIKAGEKDKAAALYPQVQKSLDMAAKKNLLHPKNAGHKKSQLAKMLAA
ncbi:30S ribosomal protein S20 [Candidatus Peribacteria bacterium]|nr:30S ribosomal protein S20 [Candidatus Peribacteria bacterium]